MNKPFTHLAKVLVIPLFLGASGCGNDFSTAVSNNFKAMYLCQDHGGFREILKNEGAMFSVECKDGLIVNGTND
ncbi:MAG: hypothetical protein KGZ83_16955 [Sulfuricella sp.]|nr:hypothetical protein [Sulfuricella sp.]